MNIVLIIISVLLLIIISILVMAYFMNKDYEINCECIINADKSVVFNYIKHLKNQDYFNKWVMLEPDMKKEFRGNDAEAGFIYYWSGKKAGEGELELKNYKDEKIIETEIRFVRPIASVAYSNYYLEQLPDHKTKLLWTNKSKMVYPLNFLLPTVKKMLEKDMNISLNNLKSILENQH